MCPNFRQGVSQIQTLVSEFQTRGVANSDIDVEISHRDVGISDRVKELKMMYAPLAQKSFILAANVGSRKRIGIKIACARLGVSSPSLAQFYNEQK